MSNHQALSSIQMDKEHFLHNLWQGENTYKSVGCIVQDLGHEFASLITFDERFARRLEEGQWNATVLHSGADQLSQVTINFWYVDSHVLGKFKHLFQTTMTQKNVCDQRDTRNNLHTRCDVLDRNLRVHRSPFYIWFLRQYLLWNEVMQ